MVVDWDNQNVRCKSQKLMNDRQSMKKLDDNECIMVEDLDDEKALWEEHCLAYL